MYGGLVMKKTIFRLAVMLLIALVTFVGCRGFFDMIFLHAPDVNASDLSGYNGSPPVGEVATMEALGLPVVTAMEFAVESVLTENQFGGFQQGMVILHPALALLFPSTGKASIETISVTDNSDSNTIDMDISVTNETYFNPTGGSVTIENFALDLLAEVDNPNFPRSANAVMDTEAAITITSFVNPDFTINNGIINVIARGDGSAVLDSQGTPISVDYYLAIDLSAGFSISAGTNASGKFIVELNFVDENQLTATELEQAWLIGDFSALEQSIDLTLTISVYDNADTLINQYVYTESTIFDLIQ